MRGEDAPFITSYQFTSPESTQGRPGQIPKLSWKGNPPREAESESLYLSGEAWLETDGPAAMLVRKIKATNQFTLSVVCAAADTEKGGLARIVSLSGDPLRRNFTLGRDQDALVSRLRTPLTGENGGNPELVVPGVFATTERRNLVLTYDGSTLRLFVDGRRCPYSLELSPGGPVFRAFWRFPHALDMRGQKTLYYGLVFTPLGCLLGLIARRGSYSWVSRMLLVGGGSLLLSGVLDYLLMSVSGRPMYAETVVTGLLFMGLPGLWLCFSRKSSGTL